MSYKQALLAPIVILCLLSVKACAPLWFGAGAAAGIGTYVYIEGDLKSNQEVSLETAYTAAQQAMGDLQYTITYKAKDAYIGEVTARDAGGKKTTVKLKKLSSNTTEINIRVGTFGDESKSRDILNTMKKHF